MVGHKGHVKKTEQRRRWDRLRNFRNNSQCGEGKGAEVNSKPLHLPAEVVKEVFSYMNIEENNCSDLLKLALVAKSWAIPAVDCLYKNVSFGSYTGMELYISKVEKQPYLGHNAQSITLSSLSGPANPEALLCRLVRACPNVKSFYAGKCPPTWISNDVLIEMSKYMKLEKLVLHFRNRLYGTALLVAVTRWPDMYYLDLTDAVGIDEGQLSEAIKSLCNLKVLRLSHEVLNRAYRDHICDNNVRAITLSHTKLKIIEFNNCIRISNAPLIQCFESLANSLECLIITGAKQISGISLAKIIEACDSLRFVNVSRSSFNDEALQYLAGESPDVTSSRTSRSITHFAMSYCPAISLAPFQAFVNVLGSRIRDGWVSHCTIYVQGNRPNLHRLRMRQIEKENEGLRIRCSKESFKFEEALGLITYLPGLAPPTPQQEDSVVDNLEPTEIRGGIAPDGVVKCGIRKFKLVVKPKCLEEPAKNN